MKKTKTQVENFGYTVKNLEKGAGGIGEQVSAMAPGKTVTDVEKPNKGVNIHPVYKTY